jgi:hypothetical protein
MIMKTIGVRFLNTSKTYYYLTDDMSVEVDDYCVVIGGDGIPAIVRVNDAAAIDIDNKATKVIVQKVDTAAYFAKMKLAAEREAKLKRLDEIAREVYRLEKYRILVSQSEEAKQLMADLGMSFTAVEENK